MIEQTGVAVTFLAQFLVSGAAGTGLTITCAVRRVSDDTEVVAATPATELGSTGIYKYEYSSPATEDLYVAHFNEAAATADQTDVASLWTVGKAGVENADAAASSLATAAALATTEGKVDLQATAAALATHDGKLDTVDTNVDTILANTSGASVTVSVPVDSTGTINLVRGDDYLNAEGRVLAFSSTGWTDLTGATAIVLSLRKRVNGLGTTLRGTVAHRVAGFVPASSGTQTVEFEPLTAVTTLLDIGTAAVAYDIQATLASGSIVTLQTGVVNVTEDQTR